MGAVISGESYVILQVRRCKRFIKSKRIRTLVSDFAYKELGGHHPVVTTSK